MTGLGKESNGRNDPRLAIVGTLKDTDGGMHDPKRWKVAISADASCYQIHIITMRLALPIVRLMGKWRQVQNGKTKAEREG